jgi:hypothetical protein
VETMWLRKEIGQSGVAGYWWEHDRDVVEVPWDLGVSLLELKGAGFSQAEEPSVDDYDPRIYSDVPAGTAVDILDWVGTDRVRAVAALAVEKSKGGEARTSLVAKLEKLAS